VANALCSLALDSKKKLVFGTNSNLPDAAVQRSYSFGIDRFKREDYAALARVWLPEKKAAAIDFEKVYRFAPKLNAHQIKAACLWLADDEKLGTEHFIDYLRYNRLASNVDLGEVQEVDLRDLRGIEDVIRNLEINVVHPLENDTLATELGLRSKHGVLLYGPPGTGKTTVGRALARRLKGKFFLIDGTFIAGSNDFYGRVHHIFEAAKENAPSVIFIDDADAIFEDGEERGLYRYLLTMLDGLESESAGRVCVVMTAMNIAHLPPALVRSGRIELWLEMKLPDTQARVEILGQHIATLPAQLRNVDKEVLCSAMGDFTGADIKRTIEDGKAIYAFDRSRNADIKSPTEYFMQAATAVAENKKRYAEAEAGIAASKAMSNAGLPSFISRHFMTTVEES
jgi:ATP-dependent 26S proteasome regulatory subunit